MTKKSMNTKAECAGRVWDGFDTIPCSRTGKHERSGKHYCGIHDPVRKAEKRKKQAEKWTRDWKAKQAVWAIERKIASLVESHPDFAGLRERLSKAQAERRKVDP